jgi:hypothetical protein
LGLEINSAGKTCLILDDGQRRLFDEELQAIEDLPVDRLEQLAGDLLDFATPSTSNVG